MTSPTPEYNPNVPQPEGVNGIFGPSQQDFFDNFTSLYNAFAANHIPLDAASEAGNHTVIQLAEQNFSQQTDAGEISVFSQKVEGQTDQIFIGYQGNQTPFQYTNYQIYSVSLTDFFTFLPGNLIVYFGTISTTTLNLIPAICKNIVTANFCNSGNSSNSPDISLIKVGDIYSSIKFNQANMLPYFYFVMGNP